MGDKEFKTCKYGMEKVIINGNGVNKNKDISVVNKGIIKSGNGKRTKQNINGKNIVQNSKFLFSISLDFADIRHKKTQRACENDTI